MNGRRSIVLSVVLLLAASVVQGVGESTNGATTSIVTTTTAVTTTAAVTTTTAVATSPSVDDRPFDVFVPASYDPATAVPLVILLHSYTGAGQLEEHYFNLVPQAEARGFLYVHPDASMDQHGSRGWNATDVCCNDGDVDDTAYLNFIIDEVSAEYSINPMRIYLVGHSNGGFMSYRMACDHADRIAAIVSFAGATFSDDSKCSPTEPVNVLEIHGTADETIKFAGGPRGLGRYPGAEATVATWSTYNGCSTSTSSLGALDLNVEIAGDETIRQGFRGCPVGGAVELWAMRDGTHTPPLTSNFAAEIIEWLYAHRNTLDIAEEFLSNPTTS